MRPAMALQAFQASNDFLSKMNGQTDRPSHNDATSHQKTPAWVMEEITEDSYALDAFFGHGLWPCQHFDHAESWTSFIREAQCCCVMTPCCFDNLVFLPRWKRGTVTSGGCALPHFDSGNSGTMGNDIPSYFALFSLILSWTLAVANPAWDSGTKRSYVLSCMVLFFLVSSWPFALTNPAWDKFYPAFAGIQLLFLWKAREKGEERKGKE